MRAGRTWHLVRYKGRRSQRTACFSFRTLAVPHPCCLRSSRASSCGQWRRLDGRRRRSRALFVNKVGSRACHRSAKLEIGILACEAADRRLGNVQPSSTVQWTARPMSFTRELSCNCERAYSLNGPTSRGHAAMRWPCSIVSKMAGNITKTLEQ